MLILDLILTLQLIDWVAITITFIILFGLIAYFIYEYRDAQSCRNVNPSAQKITFWRINLYGSVYSGWLIAIFTFTLNSGIRFVFWFSFLAMMVYNFFISWPAWICKQVGHGDICNCDFYEHYDLAPMFTLGLVGTFVLAFLGLVDGLSTWLTLVGLFIISLGVLFLLPEKKKKALVVPEKIRLDNIDQLLEFIEFNPKRPMFIFVVGQNCDFCMNQITELERIIDDIINNARVLFLEDIQDNELFRFLLNIDLDQINPPLVIYLNEGQIIDYVEKILTAEEILQKIKHYPKDGNKLTL